MSPAERTVTPLVSEIETLVSGVHGLSPIDQLFGLSMLAHTTSHLAGDVVDVGSSFGRSAIALGAAVRDTHGKLHCVDLFPEKDDRRQDAYNEHANVFEGFRANIRNSGLESVVVPFRGTAAAFVAQLPKSFRCRLIFLDGDHGYKAVRDDIATLTPLLVPGGWICFDDAFSTYEGVNRAVTELVVESPCFDLKRQITRKCFAARKALRV